VINTRVVFGGISHETNSFSPYPTELKDFTVIRGEEILRRFKGSRDRITGIIDGCLEHGYEPVPTIYAECCPSGTITKETLDTLVRELLKGIKDAHPFDGSCLFCMALALVRAMTTLRIISYLRCEILSETRCP
jgi:microcystin degradation protein MlrC